MMKSLLQPRGLLCALASGEPVSGALLAERTGVTRAAIWKQVAALRRRGLPVQARTGLGYSLPWPIQLLDAEAIAAQPEAAAAGLVEAHWELDSTSSELTRRKETLPDMAVVLAETQTAGRGRRGRQWLSPPGLNLYLSCLKRFEHGFAGLSGLSLAVGVCVVQALEDLGIRGAGLKWPNDVHADDGKLAGILVELGGEYQGPCTAIIGVGINVRLPPALQARITQPATDLVRLVGAVAPDRNRLAATLIGRLDAGLSGFASDGFDAFAAEFARMDRLHGKALQLHATDGNFAGIGAGVDAHGALRVRTDRGERLVDSAQITVRAR